MGKRLLSCLGALCLAASAGCDVTGRPVADAQGPADARTPARAKPPSEQDLAAIGRTTSARFLSSLPPAPPAASLPFEVERADYYQQVTKALKLNPAETALLAKNGFVIVDHDQRYTFTSAYVGVYTRDLPVLITTDSCCTRAWATRATWSR